MFLGYPVPLIVCGCLFGPPVKPPNKDATVWTIGVYGSVICGPPPRFMLGDEERYEVRVKCSLVGPLLSSICSISPSSGSGASFQGLWLCQGWAGGGDGGCKYSSTWASRGSCVRSIYEAGQQRAKLKKERVRKTNDFNDVRSTIWTL